MSVMIKKIVCDECGTTEWDFKDRDYYCRNCGEKMTDEKISKELKAATRKLKEMNDIKVYKMNDYEWWATNGELDDLIYYYRENIDDSYTYIEECDIDKEGMWYQTEDEEDLERLGESDEIISYEVVDGIPRSKAQFGDLMRRDGEVFKLIPYREAIQKNGECIEPYMIACTEW